MAFLVGVGDQEPLRFRLLPVDEYMNTGALHQMGAAACWAGSCLSTGV